MSLKTPDVIPGYFNIGKAASAITLVALILPQ